MNEVEREDVTFTSEGASCRGWLCTSGAAHLRPGIVMAHGLGAVKEMYLEPFARTFAAAGFAALLFDYRCWGASDGEPRQHVDPRAQHEDYRSAISYLQQRADVDPDMIGAWGTSFSGGHVLHLGAFDPRIKAVVSQVPAVDLPGNAERLLGADGLAGMRAMLAADRRHRYPDTPPPYIPLSAPAGDLALQADDETHAWLEAARATVAPAHENRVTLSSGERILEYTPAANIHRIAPTPLLVITTTGDRYTPTDLVEDAFARAGEPKRLVRVPGGHYAVYEEPGQSEAAAAACAWLQTHLQVSARAAS
jgi:fermentation-respiration switch protein FrsA (DUF1100 family)